MILTVASIVKPSELEKSAAISVEWYKRPAMSQYGISGMQFRLYYGFIRRKINHCLTTRSCTHPWTLWKRTYGFTTKMKHHRRQWMNFQPQRPKNRTSKEGPRFKHVYLHFLLHIGWYSLLSRMKLQTRDSILWYSRSFVSFYHVLIIYSDKLIIFRNNNIYKSQYRFWVHFWFKFRFVFIQFAWVDFRELYFILKFHLVIIIQEKLNGVVRFFDVVHLE